MRNDTRYVALTRGAKGAWWVVYVGEPGQSQDEVREIARAQIINRRPEAFPYSLLDPELDSLTVVSKSGAQQAFSTAWRAYEYQASAGAPH